MSEMFRDSLRDAPVIRFDAYEYFIHPLTDGVPAIDPTLLEAVVDDILAVVDLTGVTRIVTPEAMGIPVGTALSLRTRIPLSIIRKRRYGLPGEIQVAQETGYSKGDLFVNGLGADDRILLLDDVVSTGGTLIPVINAITKAGIAIEDILVLIEKGEGRARVESACGRAVKTLVQLAVVDGRVVLEDLAPPLSRG